MNHLVAKVAGKSKGERAENVNTQGSGAARRVLVVGVGGAGCAAMQWVEEDCPEAATIALNTDRVALEFHPVDSRMLIGDDLFHGHGAQGHLEAARRAANEARAELAARVRGFDLVAVLTSLGGGTGAGVAPVVAAVARSAGAAVVAVAVLPFRVERTRRARAFAALHALRREAHTTILIDSEALLPVAGHLPINQAMGLLDYFMAEVPRALVRAAHAEAQTLVLAGGIGTVAYAEWTGTQFESARHTVMLPAARGEPHLALIHVESHDGAAPAPSHALASHVAAATRAAPCPDDSRVSLGRDARLPEGGRVISILTGLEAPVEAEGPAPSVSIEPTRVAPVVAPPTVREAPEESEADPAPIRDAVQRTL